MGLGLMQAVFLYSACRIKGEYKVHTTNYKKK